MIAVADGALHGSNTFGLEIFCGVLAFERGKHQFAYDIVSIVRIESRRDLARRRIKIIEQKRIEKVMRIALWTYGRLRSFAASSALAHNSREARTKLWVAVGSSVNRVRRRDA